MIPGFDLITIIQTVGYAGLFAIAFAESGILFGIFLPGDSLLFVSGVLAAQGYFNIWVLIFLFPLGGILGDSVGYWFGKKVGAALYDRPDSRFFKRAYIERTKRFYEQYGAKAVVLARFVPIVRTLTPILAGVGAMHYPTFLKFNIVGGLAWGVLIPLAGYYLGDMIPESYILPISLVIVFVSFIPAIVELVREKKRDL